VHERSKVLVIADRKTALRRKAAEIEAQWTEQEAHEEASMAKQHALGERITGTRKRIAIEEDHWFNDHVDEIQHVVQQSESMAVLAQRQSDASEMVSTVSIKQEKI
jgi:hypothetical protein